MLEAAMRQLALLVVTKYFECHYILGITWLILVRRPCIAWIIFVVRVMPCHQALWMPLYTRQHLIDINKHVPCVCGLVAWWRSIIETEALPPIKVVALPLNQKLASQLWSCNGLWENWLVLVSCSSSIARVQVCCLYCMLDATCNHLSCNVASGLR